MNTQSSAIVITRRGLGSFGSLIGFGGIVGGVVLLIWQGQFSFPVIAAFVIGVIGLAVWGTLVPDEFRAFVRGRAIRHSTATIFGSVLLLGIVAMTYLLIARAALTWDLTLNQRFSLTTVSQNVVRRISRPMQITGFYTSRALGLREIDDQYWRMYEDASNGMIRRVYYDPEEVPGIAQSFGVTEDPQVFLSYLNDDGSVDFSLVSRVILTDTQERDMTTAISRMLIAGSITVYLDTSLGERDPLDTTTEGITAINNGMRESGLITYPLDITNIANTGGDIPQDASAVIFARPLTDLNAEETAVVRRYLDAGGSLLLVTDVLFNPTPFLQQDGQFNTYLWENYGIRALDAAVVDYGSAQTTPLEITGGALYQEQEELSANLGSNPTLFRLARALEVNLNFGNPDVANGRLIVSSGDSYAETNWDLLGQTNTYAYDEGADQQGPIALVVWAHNEHNNSRIVMVGDSDFIANGLVASTPGTGDAILFTNAVTWLTHMNEAISFGIQGFANNLPIFYTTDQRDAIFFVTVFVIPGVVLVTGLTVWARRVRR